MTAMLSEGSNCIICHINTTAEIYCLKIMTRGKYLDDACGIIIN